MTEIDPGAVREDLAQAAEAAGSYPRSRFGGRGLVVCAGGPRLLTNAYVLVRVLREIHGSRLPIEIWHAGPAEMPEVMANIFQEYGCRLIDGLGDGAGIHDGWALKARALAHSTFEEVLLLDADQVPLIDPAQVFDWQEFRSTGAVFWPDIVDLSESNPIWTLLGLAPRRVRSWDSGQLCIDKRRCWRALAVVQRMNERADLFYRLVYGDKDTFLAGWAMTGAACAVVPHEPLRDIRFLAQRSFDGAVVFQHRTKCKFQLGAPPIRPDGFFLQAECEAMLHDLGRVWNGRSFAPPARSAAARALEHELVDKGHFDLVVAGQAPAPVQLLPGHQVGEGRSERLQNWYAEEDADGDLLLVLHDIGGAWVRLAPDPFGEWRGAAGAGEGPAVLLAPARSKGEPRAPAATRTLVDDLLQAALATPGAPDLAGLEAALQLLAPGEPEAAKRIARRAACLAEGDPGLAGALVALAGRLPAQVPDRDMRPNSASNSILGRTDRYRSPAALKR